MPELMSRPAFWADLHQSRVDCNWSESGRTHAWVTVIRSLGDRILPTRDHSARPARHVKKKIERKFRRQSKSISAVCSSITLMRYVVNLLQELPSLTFDYSYRPESGDFLRDPGPID